jgi:hypothetical protein
VVLRGVVDLLKAESLEELTMRPKTDHPLRGLIAFLKISKNSYEYQHHIMGCPDKYAVLRMRDSEAFEAHGAR